MHDAEIVAIGLREIAKLWSARDPRELWSPQRIAAQLEASAVELESIAKAEQNVNREALELLGPMPGTAVFRSGRHASFAHSPLFDTFDADSRN